MNEQDDDGWWRFLELCRQTKTREDFDRLFKVFLTYEERDSIAGRYQIIKALLAGEYTQREIAQHYGVSIAKITRGSNELKQTDEKLQRFLRKVMV